MAAPELWGPRLWNLLHTLADLSDRIDVYPLWNSFLKATTTNIPCQKCQVHMAEYWRTHTFLPKGWQFMTAEQVRQDIRQKIHAFHNAVNERLGKPSVPLATLGPINRFKLYQIVRTEFEFLKATWPSIRMEWKQATTLLISIVQSGTFTGTKQ